MPGRDSGHLWASLCGCESKTAAAVQRKAELSALIAARSRAVGAGRLHPVLVRPGGVEACWEANESVPPYGV